MNCKLIILHQYKRDVPYTTCTQLRIDLVPISVDFRA